MRSKNINKDASGNGPGSDFINRTLERHTELQFYDSQTIKVEQTTRGTRFHAKIPPASGGTSGFPWMYPAHKELDPTLAYSAGFVAYLSPQNPLAVTGLKDLASNTLTVAQAGMWLALQDVPAQVVNPGGHPAGTYYNVPQIAAQGATSGTPLKGDLDASTLFWARLPETNSCM